MRTEKKVVMHFHGKYRVLLECILIEAFKIYYEQQSMRV